MALSKPLTIDVELTVDTDAYTALDVVGGLLTFAVGSPTGGCILNSVTLIDEDNQSEDYKLYLFDSKPTVIADDAAYAPAIADVRKRVRTIDIVAYEDPATHGMGRTPVLFRDSHTEAMPVDERFREMVAEAERRSAAAYGDQSP